MAGPASSPSRSLRSQALPWLVLIAGLALSVAIWFSVRREQGRQDMARFERLQERVLSAIDARFQSAEQALHGGRALVESAGELSPAQWKHFVDSVSAFFDRGVVGLGYVQRVRRAELDATEARIRAVRRGFIRERPGDNPDVFLVTHIEPMSRNAPALGKDVGSGTKRRGAAEQAMRTGAPVLKIGRAHV